MIKIIHSCANKHGFYLSCDNKYLFTKRNSKYLFKNGFIFYFFPKFFPKSVYLISFNLNKSLESCLSTLLVCPCSSCFILILRWFSDQIVNHVTPKCEIPSKQI